MRVLLPYKGLFGINAIEDTSLDNRKTISTRGDSFVESHHTDERNIIPQVATRELSDKGIGKDLMCFGIGMTGNSVADYYYNIPKHKQLKSIVSHFIVITNI